MSTHAHFAGEFGAQKMTKKLEKDPAYRAARAHHYAGEAQVAAETHRTSASKSERAAAALVVAHAEKRTKSHALAAEKLAPGSTHAAEAKAAHASASKTHQILKAREETGAAGATQKMKPVSQAELARAIKTVVSKQSPTPPLQAKKTPESVAVTTQLPVIHEIPDAWKNHAQPQDIAKTATKSAFALTKKASDDPTKESQSAAASAHKEAALVNKHDAEAHALHERMAAHHENRAETMHLDGIAPKYTETARPAGGSQGGRWFKDEHNEEWFGKHYKGATDRMEVEHLTNQIYRKMGISAPETRIANVDGKKILMSRELKGQVAGSASKLHDTDIHKGFVHDAWLANHDVVGLEHDNVLVSGKTAHRIDNGGALIYRAMGGKKDFGAEVKELHSMRDKQYPAGQVFHKIKDDDLKKQLHEFSHSYDTHREHIDSLITKSGLSENAKSEIRTGLHARAQYLKDYLKKNGG